MKPKLISCQYCEETDRINITPKLIVLTGGPGAGKTAVLESIRKLVCPHVAILPEAASILFEGGFWRLPSRSARLASQRAIYHVQQEMQNLALGEKKWSVILCDRGTLDGFAYWPGSQGDFFHSFNTSLEDEYKKYHAVIHMRSPSSDNGYNLQNPVRIETAEAAAKIDEEIYEIWKDHPQYFLVESSENFVDKMNATIALIQEIIRSLTEI